MFLLSFVGSCIGDKWLKMAKVFVSHIPNKLGVVKPPGLRWTDQTSTLSGKGEVTASDARRIVNAPPKVARRFTIDAVLCGVSAALALCVGLARNGDSVGRWIYHIRDVVDVSNVKAKAKATRLTAGGGRVTINAANRIVAVFGHPQISLEGGIYTNYSRIYTTQRRVALVMNTLNTILCFGAGDGEIVGVGIEPGAIVYAW